MIWPFSILEQRERRIRQEVEEVYRRDFLTRKQIEALPIKEVTRDEAFELLCDPKLVVPIHYPVDVRQKPEEVGYTKKFRYVVRKHR